MRVPINDDSYEDDPRVFPPSPQIHIPDIAYEAGRDAGTQELAHCKACLEKIGTLLGVKYILHLADPEPPYEYVVRAVESLKERLEREEKLCRDLREERDERNAMETQKKIKPPAKWKEMLVSSEDGPVELRWEQDIWYLVCYKGKTPIVGSVDRMPLSEAIGAMQYFIARAAQVFGENQ